MAERPNCLLLLADHVRQDALGGVAAPTPHTPNLNELARRGSRHYACYATSPRAASTCRDLLTRDAWTERFAANGYQTGWFPTPDLADALPPAVDLPALVQRAAAWIAEAPEPWCAIVYLGSVTRITPDPDLSIDEVDIPAPVLVPGALANRPPAVKAAGAGGDRERIMAARRYYCRAVATLDRHLGRLFAAADPTRTVTVFAPLRGAMLGDHELDGDGPLYYDPYLNVPLLIATPEAAARHENYDIVQTGDIGPAILAAAGLMATAPGDTATSERHRPAVALDQDGEGSWSAMVRRGDYKLILYHAPGGGLPDGELFDVEHDWSELNNLFDMPEYWGIRLGLTERLLHYLLGR